MRIFFIFFVFFVFDTAKVSQIMLLIWVFITLQFIINLIPCIAVQYYIFELLT